MLDHRHAFDHPHEDDHGHGPHQHGSAHGHGHSHGLVDRSILRSRAGIRAVAISLGVLTVTALIQAYLYSRTLSVALLADLIHNFGDALTAIPLGLAFYFRSARGERLAGLIVVLTIFISACVALVQTIERFINPRDLTHLWWLAAAGVIGFVGNEIAAQIRSRAGHRLDSPALIADGNHARVDGFVSLGVAQCHSRRGGPTSRRSPDRPGHHARDPQDHLGLVAYGAWRSYGDRSGARHAASC